MNRAALVCVGVLLLVIGGAWGAKNYIDLERRNAEAKEVLSSDQIRARILERRPTKDQLETRMWVGVVAFALGAAVLASAPFTSKPKPPVEP